MSFTLEQVDVIRSGGKQALRGVSLRARRGERIALIGPSGAGKSTLLALLATGLRPDRGEISLLGEAPWRLDARALRALRSRVGMVHQASPIAARQRVVTAVLAGRLGQWPWWKAAASLFYPADLDGAADALARLGLEDHLFERCDRLSGGQLQRIGVARTLYQRAELVLADEPVSALDPALSDRTIEVLVDDAVTRGATLLASLHAVDLALRWFPRIVGIRAGEILFDLPAAEVGRDRLTELYASEDGHIPVQSETRAAEPPLADARAAASCRSPRHAG